MRKGNRGFYRKKPSLLWIFVAFLLFVWPCVPPAKATENKWSGVDETVVEKYAAEQGRPARSPFIDTNQGDLLLFVFLLAGTVGGFTAGYYWRVIMERKDQPGGQKSRGKLAS